MESDSPDNWPYEKWEVEGVGTISQEWNSWDIAVSDLAKTAYETHQELWILLRGI